MFKKIGSFILGIAISTILQIAGLPLRGILPVPDPNLNIFYSTIGVVASVAVAIYFAWRKNWLLASGLIVGIPFWWFFIFFLMAITGNWL